MKKTRFAAGALALAMLAGCSAGPDLVAAPDDLAFQAADLRRDSQLFTVDGEGVAAEEYLFWLVNAIAEQRYYGRLSDDADWSQAEEGQPSAETLKADALETAKLYQVIRNQATALGVELSAEEREQMDTDLKGFIETSFGDEETFRQEFLDEQCISMEGFGALNEVSYLNRAIREKLEQDGTLTATDADVEAYVAERGIYAAKHILVATRHINADGSHEEYTEEEKARALELAKDLREQLRAAGDSEEKFDELMAEYSEDGRDEKGELYAPEGYLCVYPQEKVTSNAQMAMVPEFEAGALGLEIGQISEPVETGYGYHIILRLAPDMDQVRQDYNSSNYKFSQLLQSWAEQAEVVTTKAYDELDPQAFYTRLQQLLEARKAARAAQITSAPDESLSPEGESPTPAETAPAG